MRWSDAHFGYRIGSRREDLSFDTRDNASGTPKSQVVDSAFTWGDDHAPRIAWKDTVIYEAHVKGLTRLHPDVPPQLRGTYAGLASAPVLDHLRRLGVTAVNLLPVHTFVDDKRLVELGLRNYWGYNTIGFFAPDMRYSATGTLGEFKTMVKVLHGAGMEVILDVVYNHTAEGNHFGPTLSFRGIDNAVYYRLAEDRRYYVDYTGTGNTLSTLHPIVLRLIFDSLRYWVTEMHVDGFRFDLATTLAREQHAFDPLRRVLRHRTPGPGAIAGQANRGAVGPGRRRLPGGRISARLVRLERPLPRRRALVLERRRRSGGRAREPPVRVERHLRAWRTRADRLDQLHYRARRLHAARPRQLQRQAQRGERRG